MSHQASPSDAAKRLEVATQNKLLLQLRTLFNQKPKESSPASVHDEFHVKLKEMYIEIISRFPAFAVDNKLELEMWNTLYKAHIDALQHVLHPHQTASANSVGQPRSLTKVKLQFLLLLDRAAGVYFTLIQRLLHSIPDTSWPKSIIGAATSYAAPTGMHKFDRLGRTSGRFDLDLATFSALHHFRTTVSQGSLRCFSDEHQKDTLVATPVAPRILSRGDRLPSQEGVPSDHSTLVSESTADVVDQTRDSSQTGISSHIPVSTSSVDRDTAVNYLTQHCLVHLGDVARYRHQINVAAGFYLWAWIVHPESGHPFNQLAILESSKVPRRPVDTSLYYYVRAIACRFPFPAASTNLKNLLRAYVSQSQSSKLNELSITSTVQPVRDACQLLTDLYIALFLQTESSVLLSLANEFVLSSSSPDPVWSTTDDRRLLRLVTVHVYLLATYLENHPEENSLPGDESTKTSIMRTLLLHVTATLIDWIAAQYLADCSNQTPAKRSLLSCLVPLLLWLRLQTARNSVSLDAAFRTYAPPMSENAVLVFNELLNTKLFSEGKRLPSAEVPPPLRCEIDWLELLRLPELSLLEGFLPLQVPTQRQLCFTRGHSPSFPFLNSLQSQDLLLDLIQPRKNPNLSANGLMDIGASDSVVIAAERAQFILCSARIIAHHFPALLGWVEELNDDALNTSLSLNGRFRFVTRRTPVLSELIPLSGTKPSLTTPTSSTGLHVIANSTETVIVDMPLTLPVTDHGVVGGNTDHNHSLSSSTASEQFLNGEKITFADNVTVENVAVHITSSARTMIEEGSRSQPVHSTPSLADPSFPPSKDVNTLSASTSGGLIVNAELAKFIQEQASQVAARQQLAGLSPGVCIADADSHNNNAQQAATTGTATGKGPKSRSFMNTPFRRDLPPRFARRLQAELLEREALEQRLGHFRNTESDANKRNISGVGALNLDQPAPLARKESEAPYELNSLLSNADPLHSPTAPSVYGALESAQLSPSSYLTSQLPANSVLMQPFMNSYQNASLNVTPRSYSMQPLPVYQSHSMSLASAHPPSIHENITFPGASTMFGNSQHTGPTPILDWRTQTASFTPVQPGEYHTTAHYMPPPLSTFSTPPVASATDNMIGGRFQCVENGSHPMHEDGSQFASLMPFHGSSDHFCQAPGFIPAPNCLATNTNKSNCVSQSMWLDGTQTMSNLSSATMVQIDVEQPFRCADVP